MFSSQITASNSFLKSSYSGIDFGICTKQVFQLCFSCVPAVLQLCFSCVSVLFQWCQKWFHWCYSDVSVLFQWCFKCVKDIEQMFNPKIKSTATNESNLPS